MMLILGKKIRHQLVRLRPTSHKLAGWLELIFVFVRWSRMGGWIYQSIWLVLMLDFCWLNQSIRPFKVTSFLEYYLGWCFRTCQHFEVEPLDYMHCWECRLYWHNLSIYCLCSLLLYWFATFNAVIDADHFIS